MSSLIVNAYRRMGNGTHTYSLYSYRLFILAVVMYVDDMDIQLAYNIVYKSVEAD